MNEGSRALSGDTECGSLWDFATAVYAREGVAEACIAAQDGAGFDVNLLLFAAWLAQRGETLNEARLGLAERRCEAWRDAVVIPLRERRRQWKQDAPHVQAYAALKALELEAERSQLRFLEALAGEPAFLEAGSMPVEAAAQARPDRSAIFAASLECLRRARAAPPGSLDDFGTVTGAAVNALFGSEKPA
jgi:uncharacterized protein (TIGR02444 family)